MTEEQVFLAALDLPDATSRAAYLDEQCGADAGLRGQVEALLASHFRSGAFLDVPAPEQVSIGSSFNNAVTIQSDIMSANQNPDDESAGLQFLAPSTRPDSLGRIGHYEVLQVLGKGGFGIVLRAFDDVLQRVVAVKVMGPQMAATSPARKRFLREARTSAQVRHDNVVQVYEVGEQPLPYLVMEFIPGETLQQRLDRIGPLDVPETLRIGRQIAEGLAAAHATDLIHRDIKPGNVLLEGGQLKVKITDFGLARAADDASMTQSGMIAGTPMYMAPEQVLGRTLDQRADLFSLGSVLYQMLAGRPPFRANTTVAVLKRVAEDTPRSIREIIPETPQWLCDIIAKLHAKNPDDRYQTAREVADVLADCEAQLKANSKLQDYSRIPRANPAAGDRWKWVAAAAVLLLPVIALAVTEFVGVTHLFRQPQATTDPIKPGGDPTPPIHVAKQEPPSADPITPAMGWVSILALPDVVADHIEFGKFTRVGEEIEGDRDETPGNTARLRFPLRIAGDYEVEAKFTRTEGQNSMDLDLPIGPKRVALIVGCYQNITVLAMLDGKDLYDNPSAVPLTLEDGHTYTLRVRITAAGQDASVTTTLDGQPHLAWKGKLSSISDGSGHFKAKTLDLNVLPVATFRFHDLRLHMLTGEATLTRPADASKLKPIAKQEPLPPTFTSSLGMEFVIVPKGKSWLGGGPDKMGDREVEIPADFYLGKYEVTQEEWEKVMGENPSHFSRTGGGGDAVKDIPDADLKRFPVENVSWDQCQFFVAKLNKLEKEAGWVYRLPTDVEWEYACRGGPMSDKLDSAFDFYFAKPTNTLLPEQANFNRGLNRTCQVGSYEANGLGLFDMHGNVWEWCGETEKAVVGVSSRVYLGGSYTDYLEDTRTALRRTKVGTRAAEFALKTAYRYMNLGLRLARVPSGALSPEAKTPPVALAPFTDADVQRIAALPAEQQVAAVVASLKERNPGLNGTASHKIADGVVTELNFNPTDDQNALTDLSPVRALPGLTSLNLWNCSAVADLGPLQGLPLTKLFISSLHVRNQVRDLNPLLGMRLTELQLYHCQVEDLKPLAGMPLTRLRIFSRQVRDCEPLQGMPLTTLDLSSCTQIQDFTPLTGLPLTVLHLNDCQIQDLQPLAGLKLTELSLAGARIRDLEQLKGMPLKKLALHRSGVTDLTPLQGMQLEEIFLTPKNITQGLNLLRDMPSLNTIGIGYATTEKWPAAEFWERWGKGEFN